MVYNGGLWSKEEKKSKVFKITIRERCRDQKVLDSLN